MHGYTAICPFLFIFRCHSKNNFTEAQSFHQSIPIFCFKSTEVWWSDENDLIHALDTWGSDLTHNSHTLLNSPPPCNFTLNSAEGPVPEWVGPVVSVCQNRWTLDPLYACPAKQMARLLPSQPSFRLDIFRHLRASSHFLAALPLRHKQIKTVSVGMDSFQFMYFYSIFAFSTSVNPSRQSKSKLQ